MAVTAGKLLFGVNVLYATYYTIVSVAVTWGYIGLVGSAFFFGASLIIAFVHLEIAHRVFLGRWFGRADVDPRRVVRTQPN